MKLFFSAYKLAKQVTAWFLRNTLMLEWYQVLTKPIEQLNHDLPNPNKKYNDDLEGFKKEVVYLHNRYYSAIAFESYLNDLYDNSQRRIQVVHNDNYNQLLNTWLIREDQPLPGTWLLSEIANDGSLSMSDLAGTWLLSERFPDNDFEIHIPTGAFTAAEQDEIRIRTENDKLLEKTFQIIEV